LLNILRLRSHADFNGLNDLEVFEMVALALVVLAVLLFGGGFAVSILWYAAVIVLVIAAVSYMTGRRGSRV
jgi:hypothetical protein